MGANPTFFLSAGEPSGDLHGAALAHALRRRWPGARLLGLAGPRMQAAGVEPIAPFDRLALMGFAEVVRHLPFFVRLMRRAVRALAAANVDLVIPIDYPGFNLRLAKRAAARDVPVLYYIAPQVWAWHRSRAGSLARMADRLAVILPFEEAVFREYGANVRYVGHPLLDRSDPVQEREAFCASLGLDPERRILAVFPGSRPQEVERHLEPFAAAARQLVEARWHIQPVVARSTDVDRPAYDDAGFPLTDDAHSLLAHAHAAMVKSGTTTLEAALAGVPMVIAYRTHPATYWLARRLVDVEHVGLANLVAGRRVAPELLQDEVKASALAERLLPLVDEGPARQAALAGLASVRESLRLDGPSTAAERVVALAAEILEER
jgi:lipid-A-disaccharide synthase